MMKFYFKIACYGNFLPFILLWIHCLWIQYNVEKPCFLLFLRQFFQIYLYLWLHWVFMLPMGFLSWCVGSSPVGPSCGVRALGPRACVVVAHRLSCPVAHGIFQDQDWTLSPALQADSQPQDQGSPPYLLFTTNMWCEDWVLEM